MATFTARDAANVLHALDANVDDGGDHIVGLVYLTPNRRIRLYYSHKRGDLPSFVFNNWKQALHLSTQELKDLAAGKLAGEEALKLIRTRLDL